MSLSIKSHMQGRAVALFVGFFGGAIAFSQFGTHLSTGVIPPFPFLLPIFAFGGAFLATFAFGRIFSAVCPKCGAESAVPVAGKNFARYVCNACGTESNALAALMGVDMAAMAAAVAAKEAQAATPEGAAQEEKKQSRFGAVFLVIGVVAIGIAIYLGQESIRLVRGGVSTDARVVRVTHHYDRGSKDNETNHTAFVEYKAGAQVRTLERSWSTSSGNLFTWPNYHQGERLRVIYLPGDPGTASIDTIPELFLPSTFLVVFGVLFGGFGLLMMFYRGKPDVAPDGSMVLTEAPQTSESSSWSFLRFAIGAAVLTVGAGAFYHFVVVQPRMERERLAQEAAAEAERTKAAIAKGVAERAAARMAAASAPVAARADMSECQRLLLAQRNQYAAKYPQYSRAFFNIRPPKGGECRDCLAELAGRLASWAGFEVVPSAYIVSDYKPGCVAYRQDIFGSARGAQCIIELLGHKYTADQSCQADGFPYTIINLAPYRQQ